MADQLLRWYALSVYAGSEDKVSDAIEEKRFSDEDFALAVKKILVPKEEVWEYKNGQRVSRERKLMPGYIMVHMIFTDHTWAILRAIPRLGGILKTGGRPSPLSDEQVERYFQGMEDKKDQCIDISFNIGEHIKVIDGPFDQMQGIVAEMDEKRRRLSVRISIFGRETPVELSFDQVERV